MNEQQIIELLKSGEFTIVYFDKDDVELYKGKWDVQAERNTDNLIKMNKSRVDMESHLFDGGHATHVVDVLVKALGGSLESL